MRQHMKQFAVLMAGMTSLAFVGTASAVECPVTHPSSNGVVLKETPAMVAQTSDRLTSSGVRAAPEIIADLRHRHPEATDAMILNYLVTAYCPAVNKRGDLSEAQKRAEIRSFNKGVGKLLFRQ